MSVCAQLCFFLLLQLKNMFWELPEISLLGTIRVFYSIAESSFGCAIFPRTLRSVLWLFTYCVWDVLRYRILIKTAFDFFGNVVFVVLYCVQLFWWFSYKLSEKYWAISPKGKHQLSKWRWIRSKNVCLCSALLFSLAATKKYVLRTSWDLSTWNNTCFLFNCRVTFWLRYFSSNGTFGTLALYILRLRCLAIPNTYKKSFWFFRKRGLRRFVLCAIVLMIFV